MAEDYAKDRLDAHNDFAESGMEVVLRGTAQAAVDIATGAPTSGGEEVEVTTYALNKNYTTKEIDGTVILTGDRRVLLSAEDVFQAGVVPAPGLYLDTPEGAFRVVACLPLAPGGVAIFYTLQLRE